jgi:hypothetical protein
VDFGELGRAAARLLRPGPLARLSDRLEALVVVGRGALVLSSAAAGRWFAASLVESGTAPSPRGAHSVIAKVHRTPGQRPAPDGSEGAPMPHLYRVTWTAPDGSARSAQLPLQLDPAAPATTKVWVDGRGNRLPQPQDLLDVLVVAGGFVVGWLLATAVVGYGAYWWARRGLDALRYRRWGREWAAVGRAGDSR